MIDALIADMRAMGFENISRSGATAGDLVNLTGTGGVQNSHSDSVVRVDAVSPINADVRATLFFNIRHSDIGGASGVALFIHSSGGSSFSMETSASSILGFLTPMV